MSYKRQLTSFAAALSDSVTSEMRLKSALVKRSIMEDAEPFIVMGTEQIERLAIMYERNQYHVRDIADALLKTAEETK